MSNKDLLRERENQFHELCKSLPEGVGYVSYEVILPRKEGHIQGWFMGDSDEKHFDCPEFDVTRIASAFANEQRVRLIKALYLRHHTFSELASQTGMTTSQLQHHLKELALAGFLIETPKRNYYELSSRGKALLLLMLCAAKWEPRLAVDKAYLSPDKAEANK